MSKGDFPESLTLAMFVGGMLVGRLGVVFSTSVYSETTGSAVVAARGRALQNILCYDILYHNLSLSIYIWY